MFIPVIRSRLKTLFLEILKENLLIYLVQYLSLVTIL